MTFKLSESDLEDYLFTHPKAVQTFSGLDINWIARQLRVPSGIIDLLGYASAGNNRPYPVVAELKSVPITAEALTQVCRYAHDIYSILLKHDGEYYNDFEEMYAIYRMVIGPGEMIAHDLLFEADALGVSIYTFRPKFDLKICGPYVFTKEARENHNRILEEASANPIFSVFDPPDEDSLLKPFEDFLDQKQDGE